MHLGQPNNEWSAYHVLGSLAWMSFCVHLMHLKHGNPKGNSSDLTICLRNSKFYSYDTTIKILTIYKNENDYDFDEYEGVIFI